MITRVNLMLVPKPLYTGVALFTLPSFSAVPGVVSAARTALEEVLSAFEFMDASSMRLLREGMPHLVAPFGSAINLSEHEGENEMGLTGNVAVLVEASGACANIEERLQTFVYEHAHDVDNKVVLAITRVRYVLFGMSEKMCQFHLCNYQGRGPLKGGFTNTTSP